MRTHPFVRPMRVLIVPDSTHWILGTIANYIVRANPWIEGTVVSASVLDQILVEHWNRLPHRIGELPEWMSRFDLVHFTCPYSSLRWLPRLAPLMPFVTSHHHVVNWELFKHNLEGDAITVGSREWEDDLRTRRADMSRVFTVPYGVDATLFRPSTKQQKQDIRRELGIAADSLCVGFFAKRGSNDDDRKGTDVFDRALRALHARMKRDEPGSELKLCALIVGPGWSEMVDSLRSSGICCVWLPFVRDSQGVARAYGALDFYWVTARVEGGPVPLLEAMSSEISCLSTPVGLARDLVHDNVNALSLPFGDAEAFATRSLELWHDPERRAQIGRAARQTILEQMHVEVTARLVAPAYACALNNFACRTGIEQSKSYSLILSPAVLAQLQPSLSSAYRRTETPLNGVPHSLRERIRMLENIVWGEILSGQGQKREALQMLGRECLSNPRSSEPWRSLMRNALPSDFVSSIIRLRHRLRGASVAPAASAHRSGL